MDGKALIASFRMRADDRAAPFLFDDELLLHYATEAEREACLRARLIWDSTSTFLNVPLVAGQRDYALDPRIDRIDHVRYVPTTGHAGALNMDDSDDLFDCHGRPERTGRPQRAAQRGKTLRIWPTPSVPYAGALLISCYRFPLEPIEGSSDEPEIPYEHHEGLVDWMLYRAFSHTDSEEQADPRSMTALAMFERRFGERPSADVLRRHRERRRVTTRYGGL